MPHTALHAVICTKYKQELNVARFPFSKRRHYICHLKFSIQTLVKIHQNPFINDPFNLTTDSKREKKKDGWLPKTTQNLNFLLCIYDSSTCQRERCILSFNFFSEKKGS